MKNESQAHAENSQSATLPQSEIQRDLTAGAPLTDPTAPRLSKGSRLCPKLFKVVTLRQAYPAVVMCDSPEAAASYWTKCVASDVRFVPDVENFVVVVLNTRRRAIGHQVVSTGSLDTVLVHPREVFKTAIALSAASIILMHNHPSGDPCPSESDVKITKGLIEGGKLMNIDVLDHVIIGQQSSVNSKGYCSIRELGYYETKSASLQQSQTPPEAKPVRRQKRMPMWNGKRLIPCGEVIMALYQVHTVLEDAIKRDFDDACAGLESLYHAIKHNPDLKEVAEGLAGIIRGGEILNKVNRLVESI